MSSKVIYERFLWFHTRVRESKYPNTRVLRKNSKYREKRPSATSLSCGTDWGAPLYFLPEWRGEA